MNQRQQDIFFLVEKQGFASIETLAKHFSVTPQTIRRDINTLCDRQLLTRRHGGTGLSAYVENVVYATRQVFLVADHSKFDRCAMVHLGSISQIDAFFTDQPLPDHISAILSENNVTMQISSGRWRNTTPFSV